MNALSFFYVVLLLYHSDNSKEIIEGQVSRFLGAFYFETILGDPEQYLHEDINLANAFTIGANYSYDIGLSSTVITIHNHTLNNNNTVTTLMDHASFRWSNFTLATFKFDLESSKSIDFINNKRGYAFAFKIADEDTSFVHLMKKNNLISSLQFSIVQRKDNFVSILFGGITEEYTNNKTVSVCKVIEKPSRVEWGFDLSYVFVNLSLNNPKANIYYKNTHYAFFQANHNKIFAPMDFISFLKKTMLKENLLNGNCNDQQDMAMILCQRKAFESIGNISFIIDEVIYSFRIQPFFECYFDFCDLIIQPSKGGDWEFGTSFLQHFSMLFDYESKSISLYSSEYRPIANISSMIIFNNMRALILISIAQGIVLLIGIFLLISSLIKKSPLFLTHSNRDIAKLI